jgi:hypothetical protein
VTKLLRIFEWKRGDEMHFEVGPIETELRERLGVTLSPRAAAIERLRHLGAFWQHWGLYKRRCEGSRASIVSLFPEQCPYPVWAKDHWLLNTERPALERMTFDQGFFETLWTLFKSSPIPHNLGTNNENCEYTDDWWNSRNCYLSHSGVNNENILYSYRVYDSRDLIFCCFAFS